MSDSDNTNPGGINRWLKNKAGPAMAALQRPAQQSEQGEGGRWLIDVDLLDTNPEQYRHEIDQDELEEFASNIELYGVLQPINVVRQDNGRFFIVTGHRRTAAMRWLRDNAKTDADKAKWSKIPATDAGPTAPGLMAELALSENIHRADPRPVETAEAIAKLKKTKKLDTTEDVAKHLGLDLTKTKRYLQIAAAPATLRGAMSKGIMVEVEGETTSAGKPKREHRTLELAHALQVLHAYRHWNSTKPKKAAELSYALIDKVLKEGWSLRKLKDHVDGLKGKGEGTPEAGEKEEQGGSDSAGSSGPAAKVLFSADEQKVVIYRSRLAEADEKSRVDLRNTLKELLSQLN